MSGRMISSGLRLVLMGCAIATFCACASEGQILGNSGSQPMEKTATNLFVEVAPSVTTPPSGRVAVPITFGWRGVEPNATTELTMTVQNGFEWAAVASLGERVDEQTVRISYKDLPQKGGTKARLRAPASWNPDLPILSVTLSNAGSDVVNGDRGTAKAINQVPGVDLFMFPPATRSLVNEAGQVSYQFTYGSQGANKVKARIELELFKGYSWVKIPDGCVAEGSTAPMACNLGKVGSEATFDILVNVPKNAVGVAQALRYAISAVDATDENPANNGGIRFVGIRRE